MQAVELATDALEKEKKYFVTFTINQKKAQQAH
jgi:hypothetical protein